MRKSVFFTVLLIAAIFFMSSQAFAGGSVNLYYGTRTFDSDDLSASGDDIGYLAYGDENIEIDSGSEFAINADFGGENWPVNIFVGIYMSGGDDSLSLGSEGQLSFDGTTWYDAQMESWGKLEIETQEIRIGVKRAFDTSVDLFPYVMGGLAYVTADVDVSYGYSLEAPEIGFADGYSQTESYDDSAVGFWLGAGVYFQFMKHYNLGVELSYSKAEVSIDDTDIEVGGLHYGAFIGYQW
jgi:opacity protein-like surface antigen